jgi:hypothetical protein
MTEPRLDERQLALPYQAVSAAEPTPASQHFVRLVWSLQEADGEFACYLVPSGDGVDTHIYEDRTLLLAQKWASEREALSFASAMKRDFISEGRRSLRGR